MSSMRKRVPAPLGWLLVAVGLLGLAWAILNPAWQAPDENSHFAYLQTVGERFDLPGDADRPFFSSEQAAAVAAVNSDQVAGVPETKPEWSEQAYRRWQQLDERLPARAREDGGGPNPAAANPPLYYLYSALAYRVASGGDIFDRLLAARVAGLLWVLLLTVGVWLLVGELFARDRTLQLAGAALAGLLPMISFISASVNPDGMLYAAWTFFLWLGVRALRRGLDLPTAAALTAVTGLALVVKATSYALLPGLALVLGLGLWRLRERPPRRLAEIVGAAALPLIATIGVWTVVARGLNRTVSGQLVGTNSTLDVQELASYLWQFYLPKLPFQSGFANAKDLPLYEIFLKQGWGAFGWLEVMYAKGVYIVLAALTAAVVVAAGVALWRTRRAVDLAIGAFFVLVVVALLAGVHWTDYHYVIGGNVNFMQGRYLFPLVGLGALALAKALTLVPAGWRANVVAAGIGLLVVLQLYGLGLVLQRYYA
jgi:4-amino-4-deoxy-L-arabinose transferase-like glycosyltransferase